MPYTTKGNRAHTRAEGPETVGDLNFLLTMRCVAYLEFSGLSYTAVNLLVGALDRALEAYLAETINMDECGLSDLARWFAVRLENYALKYADHDNSPDLDDAVTGVVRCCQMELYTRVARPYEDKKIVENGDVFPPELTGMNP